MNNSVIRELKREIRALERAELLGKNEEVIVIAKKIQVVAALIAEGAEQPPASPKVLNDPLICGRVERQIEILYKPITVINPMEGDYLVRFSEERTQDLKRAEALEVHNSFWMKNEVVGSSLYGSIPAAIIGAEMQRKLSAAGWDKAICDVQSFDATENPQKILKQCKAGAKQFLLFKNQHDGRLIVVTPT